jgi:AP-3 complex subunit sigma
MIHAILVINNQGQPRLIKFFRDIPHTQREGIIREVYNAVSKRPDNVCNFLEITSSSTFLTAFAAAQSGGQSQSSGSSVSSPSTGNSLYSSYPSSISEMKIIYRHYATLYFVFIADETESELGILDLIQVFVESLDKSIQNVCEKDLIYQIDRIHFILDEIIMGGMVLETSLKEIVKAIHGSTAYARATEADSQTKTTVIGKKLGL